MVTTETFIAEPPAISVSTTGSTVSCNGDTNGSISATVIGGTAPYVYDWDNAADIQNPTGLIAGIYLVTITDANTCEFTASAEVVQPEVLSASIVGDALDCNGDMDGNISLSVIGGTTPYTFEWNNGLTDQNPIGLGEGNYTVTITDFNDCSILISTQVTAPVILDATLTGEALLCNGDSNGDINTVVTGGTPPYSFAWTNGAGIAQNPSNLTANIYTVVITDANNCNLTLSTEITEPSALDISAVGETLLCNGDTDGNISLTVNGGTTPYTFNWDNGVGAIQNPSGLTVGIYNVTVTDANNCSMITSAEIVEPNQLMSSLNGVSLLCNGDLANLNLAVSGGTTPYIFNWDNGAGTDQNPTNLGAGIYNVTITDANNCMLFTSAEITEPLLLTGSINDEAVLCNGDLANLNLAVSGGTTPYAFNWDNGAGTDQNPINLGAGIYNVTVTDANACVVFTSAEITEPSILTATAIGEALLCNGDLDGNIDLTVLGGTSPYAFAWDNGAGSLEDPSGLSIGTYNVTVTDTNGCTVTTSAQITEPNLLTSSATGSALLCNGDADGLINLMVSGGTTPYSFNWDNGGGTDQNPINLGAGVYNVTVTDANNCMVFSSAEITEPSLLTSTTNNIAVLCNGELANLTLTVSGGTTPYSFTWDNGAGTDQNPTSLGAGIYNVTVTDANNCKVFTSAEITEPLLLTATALGEDLLCNGDTDGNIDLTVSGGTSPYTFTWDNGAGSLEDPSNLSVGTYHVTVTDMNGCIVTSSAQINEPSLLVSSAIASPLLCNADMDGSITLSVSGGSTPYTFTWDNGAGTDQNPTGLNSGIYNVTVTDANNCFSFSSTEILEPVLLGFTINPTTLNCNGDTNGAITLTVNDGTPPYQYNWDNGAGNVQSPVGLSAGVYNVTVTDANGCLIFSSAEIIEPPALDITAVGEALLCNGDIDGDLTLGIIGGTSPYAIQWDNGAGTDQNPSGLGAGNYTVTVVDANNCIAISSAQITEPSLLTGSTLGEALLCNGDMDGDISLTLNGGTTPYSFVWDNGAGTDQNPSGLGVGVYHVTVTDSNNCLLSLSAEITEPTLLNSSITGDALNCFGDNNGSIAIIINDGTPPYSYNWDNGAGTNPNPTGLTAGIYNITVTDANGCTIFNSTEITEPPLLTISAVGETLLCNGDTNGDISLTVTGGTTPYSFVWDNGAGTNQNPSGLGFGNYNVTVTDANGCAVNTFAQITEPPALQTSTLGDALACFGDTDGIISVTAVGGVAPYSYLWEGGIGTDQSISNLGVGIYNVTVTDDNGCEATNFAQIIQSSDITLSFTNGVVSCFGDNTGSVSVDVNGGNPPYTYDWGNNAADVQTPTNLPAGFYPITVTDANGCGLLGTAEVVQPSLIIATATEGFVGCQGDLDGSISLTVSGGTTPYSFDWDNAPDVQNPTGLGAGTYNVTITDANGCVRSLSTQVSVPPAISISATGDVLLCHGATTGTLSSTVIGGVGPYNFVWDNGAGTSPNPNGLPAGVYNITVVDSNGCSATSSAQIIEPSLFSASTIGDQLACFGDNNGSISVTASGGTPPYSYDWDNATDIANPNNLSVGNYVVTITDANSCQITASTQITEPTDLIVGIDSDQLVCFGDVNGALNVTASGGTAPYSFSWNNAPNVQNPTGLSAGNYMVTITDNNGCAKTLTTTITEPTQLIGTLNNEVLSCNGASDGSLMANASGGTPPYTFVWDNNAGNGENPTGLPAGNYNVTVTDINQCILVMGATISEPPLLSIIIDNNTSANCLACNGSIDISVIGGTAPYSYIWSTGTTEQDASGLCAGTNAVTVTDALGCIAELPITTGQVTTFGLDELVVDANASCFGNCDGAASITVFGGNPPYNYIWESGNPSNPIATGICPGQYGVTVTDQDGCEVNGVFLIQEPPLLEVTITEDQPVDCFGEDNGQATITTTGGTEPISILWDNNETTNTAVQLAGGLHTVSVTDANGCLLTSDIFINSPGAPLGIDLLDSGDANCQSCDGFIDLSFSGGTAPYNILWSNGATTEDISDLCAGTYQVTVSDINSCTETASFNINNVSTLVITGVLFDADLACFGDCNAAATVVVSGGEMPYIFQWDANAGNQTTASVNGLCAGTYNVSVSDQDGCLEVQQVVVAQPTPLLANTISNAEVSCFGVLDGAATVSASGGTNPYNYLWDNNTTDANVTNLSGGIHQVTVTDSNNCVLVATVNINEPTILDGIATVTSDYNGQDISCFGNSDASISVNPTGGTLPYSYNWTGPGGPYTTSSPMVGAGDYFVTVTDANGCEITSTISVTEPDVLDVQLTEDQVDCFGDATGSISTTVTGGTMPYSYIWNNNESTGAISGLTAGIYSVTVVDANGCQMVTFSNITQPLAPLSTSISGVNIDCNGNNTGSIDLSVSGGTSPYSFDWIGPNGPYNSEDLLNISAGTYQVMVTDANGCIETNSITLTEPNALTLDIQGYALNCFGDTDGNIQMDIIGGTLPFNIDWDAAPDVEDPSGLGVGVYNVTVTDFNGCVVTGSASITEPLLLDGNVVGSPVTCFGTCDGSAVAILSGGTGPFSYSWDNGEVIPIPIGLCAGIHSVTITDANGCAIIRTTDIGTPSQITGTIDGLIAPLCFGGVDGSATITVAGGSAPYTYLWDSGETTNIATNLNSGNHSVTVTDVLGCNEVWMTMVPSLPELTFNLAGTNISCDGGADGTLIASPQGGTYPYTYYWTSDGPLGGVQDSIALNLVAGPYSVTVIDANGCEIVENITLSQPNSISIAFSSIGDATCHNSGDGFAIAVASGGTAPYTYAWDTDPQQTGPSAANLDPGTYTVTVTDGNGCEETESVVINGPAAIDPGTWTSSTVNCYENGDGSISISGTTGGTPPYTYTWSTNPTQTGTTVTGLGAGFYSVTVVDSNGCFEVVSDIEIIGPTSPLTATIDGTDPTCFDGVDGIVTLNVEGGTSPYSYVWNNGSNADSLIGIGAGFYEVTITDTRGCFIIRDITIGEPAPIIPVSIVESIICNGDDNGRIIVDDVINGVPPFVYSLDGNNYQASPVFYGLTPNDYVVYVMDLDGCVGTEEVTITEPEELVIGLSPDVSIFLGDSLQLNATISPLGANVTYSWSPAEYLSCTDCPNPELFPLETITYTLEVTDENGCVAIASIKVNVDKPRDVYIPNAFTPNEDGTNDIFHIYSDQSVEQVETFKIYDRWGELVFEDFGFQTNDPAHGWNGIFRGKRMNPAVFVYFAEIRFIDGKVVLYKGDVTLIR